MVTRSPDTLCRDESASSEPRDDRNAHGSPPGLKLESLSAAWLGKLRAKHPSFSFLATMAAVSRPGMHGRVLAGRQIVLLF